MMFNGDFCVHGRLNAPNGNEAKIKMKHPSIIPTLRFEICGLTELEIPGCSLKDKEAHKKRNKAIIFLNIVLQSH